MLAALIGIGVVAAGLAVWGLVNAWEPRTPDAIVVPDKDVAAEDAAWRDRIDTWADDGVLDALLAVDRKFVRRVAEEFLAGKSVVDLGAGLGAGRRHPVEAIGASSGVGVVRRWRTAAPAVRRPPTIRIRESADIRRRMSGLAG